MCCHGTDFSAEGASQEEPNIKRLLGDCSEDRRLVGGLKGQCP